MMELTHCNTPSFSKIISCYTEVICHHMPCFFPLFFVRSVVHLLIELHLYPTLNFAVVMCGRDQKHHACLNMEINYIVHWMWKSTKDFTWCTHSFFLFSFLLVCIITENSGGARIVVIQHLRFQKIYSPLFVCSLPQKNTILFAEIDTLSNDGAGYHINAILTKTGFCQILF